MAESGGQPGNKNAAKSRLFEQAFMREIKARDIKDGDGETLRKIAARLIDMATSGDVAAFRESRDTLDGKPAQSIALNADIALHKAAELSDDQLAAIANASGTAQT